MHRGRGQSVAVSDGQHRQFRPIRRKQWPPGGGLGHFQRRRHQQAQTAQKVLLRLDPEHQGDPGGADIRRFHNHIGHRQSRPIIVKIVDPEPAPGHWPARVDHSVFIDQTHFQRLGHGEYLEHRPQFIHPLHRPVEQRAVGGVAAGQGGRAVVGVEIGQAGHGDNLAGMHIHDDACGPFGIHQGHATGQHFLHRGLHGQVDRQVQRGTLIGGIAQILIKLPFHASDADHFGRCHIFAAKAGPTQNMRRNRAIGIQAHFARAKQQAGIADIHHLRHLFGADLTADPDKAPFAGKIAHQPVLIKLGKDRGEFCRRPDRFDHLLWLGIQ